MQAPLGGGHDLEPSSSLQRRQFRKGAGSQGPPALMLSAAGRVGHAFLKRDLGVAAASTRLDVYLESKWQWFKQNGSSSIPGRTILLTVKDSNTLLGDPWEVSEANIFYLVRF